MRDGDGSSARKEKKIGADDGGGDVGSGRCCLIIESAEDHELTS
jgi:hypothetical protein